MADEKKSFWETLPGILTGLAGVITALASLVTLFVRSNNKTTAAETAPQHESAPHQPQHSSAPSERQSIIDVRGIWRDVLLGTRVQIEQDGEQIKTKTYNTATGQQLASGEGVLDGRSMVGTNRWVTGATYSIETKLSRDGKTITGTYKNPLTGESGLVHLAR